MARERALSALGVLWLAFVGLFFFKNWSPLSVLGEQAPLIPLDLLASTLSLFSDGLRPLIYLLMLLLSAIGLGGAALYPFRLDMDTGRRFTFSAALGLGILANLTLLLGLAGLFNRFGYLFLSAVVMASAAAGVLSLAKALRGLSVSKRVSGSGALFWAIAILAALFLLGKALKPAVFYDAVTVHLGLPNYYIQEGRIGYLPYDSYSNFPFLAEMLYTLGIFLLGLKLAQFTSVLVFFLLAASVYDICRTAAGGSEKRSEALAGVLVLLTPALFFESVLYKNDLHLAYYAVLTFHALLLWSDTKKTGFLALAGILAGLCMSVKYLALVFVVPPAFFAVLFLGGSKRPTGKRLLGDAAIFLLPAAAVFLPWAIKNLVFTGNPVYPLLYGIMGGRDMSSALYGRVFTETGRLSLQQALSGVFVDWFRLSVGVPKDITMKYGVAAFLGPVACAFLPLFLLLRSKPPGMKSLLWLGVAIYASWCALFTVTRYLYPSVVLLLAVSAYAIVRLGGEGGLPLKAATYSSTAFFLAFNLCLGFYLVNDWTATTGLEHYGEPDGRFIERRMKIGNGPILASYPLYRYLNEHAPRDSRVLVIGDYQHLYLERRHICASSSSASTPYDFFRSYSGDPARIYGHLKEEGITHIVFNPEEMVRLERLGELSYPEGDNRLITDFLKSRYVRPLLSSNETGRPVYLFEVSASKP